MKTKLLFIVLLFFSTAAHSQDNYMALCFGRGSALGDFSKTKDIFNNGFAEKGFAASYSGAYYPYKKLGLSGSIGFNTNYLSIEETQNALFALVPEELIPTDYTNNSNFGQWNIVSVHLGPQFTCPIGNLSLDFFLLGGFDIVFSPGMEVNLIEDDNPENVYYTALSTDNASFGFDGGMAIRYQLNENTGIRIYTNYVHTSAKGTLHWEHPDGMINTDSDFKTKIQIHNIGLGLIYRL